MRCCLKSAVRHLIGDRIPIVDLGLHSDTILKLKRNGIDTVDFLIDFYEAYWSTSTSYLSEVSQKLDEYLRSILSMVIGEDAAVTVDVHEASSEKNSQERNKTAADTTVPNACFIRHAMLEQARVYYEEQDRLLKELELSTRSLNALERSGIHTLSQLLACTEKDMDRIRNLGAKSKAEIQTVVMHLLDDAKLANTAPKEPRSRRS